MITRIRLRKTKLIPRKNTRDQNMHIGVCRHIIIIVFLVKMISSYGPARPVDASRPGYQNGGLTCYKITRGTPGAHGLAAGRRA